MEVSGFYQHEQSMDVVIEIKGVIPDRGYSITWWNLGWVGKPYKVDSYKIVSIKNPEQWKFVGYECPKRFTKEA